ncbi:hypothetical protein L1987_53335 [Smallanthus sonchifolius]|uniref:Uncharacterized protein n=1 Tax=Smallanthus sonchifolius TaxID=185202 RepID=A0ACB9EUY9_9ASTR|nr:hypothetical protein L1987_53335 [Smallanthus sonchifolius]
MGLGKWKSSEWQCVPNWELNVYKPRSRNCLSGCYPRMMYILLNVYATGLDPRRQRHNRRDTYLAISLLLNHPNVLNKLQDEIDHHVGKYRIVDESDLKYLVFLEAIIKESFRFYPSAPLLGPIEAMVDCTVAGYNVKAGTRLIINVWKLQRDERVWSDPTKFQLERSSGGHDRRPWIDYSKKKALEVVLTPLLPTRLYGC